MTEPLFFDCLTDAQCWALFDSGVLHSYRLPLEVYDRLERMAPSHGCFLFILPANAALPNLRDMFCGLAEAAEQSSAPQDSDFLRLCVSEEELRSAIESFCTRAQADRPVAGRRIHLFVTYPRPELRTGPYLEPQTHDLSAMSLAELEAYLDEMLRLDDEATDSQVR